MGSVRGRRQPRRGADLRRELLRPAQQARRTAFGPFSAFALFAELYGVPLTGCGYGRFAPIPVMASVAR
jgi:hypothetical protein